MRSRASAVAVLVAAAFALASCGIPIDASPQAVPAGEVPVALFESSPTLPVTPTTIRSDHAVPVSIYFEAPAGLVPVVRPLPKPATLQGVLDELDAGPTTEETSKGIQSELPAGARLVGIGVHKAVATVEIDSTFNTITTTQSVRAYAEIVYSVTDLPGVTGVRFEYLGEPILAQIGSGALAGPGPVRRSDYSALLAS